VRPSGARDCSANLSLAVHRKRSQRRRWARRRDPELPQETAWNRADELLLSTFGVETTWWAQADHSRYRLRPKGGGRLRGTTRFSRAGPAPGLMDQWLIRHFYSCTVFLRHENLQLAGWGADPHVEPVPVKLASLTERSTINCYLELARLTSSFKS